MNLIPGLSGDFFLGLKRWASFDMSSEASLQSIRAKQQLAFQKEPQPTLSSRLDRLRRLERLLLDHGDEISSAIAADFSGRPEVETGLLELFPSLEGIAYARKNLRRWMRDERRHVSLWFKPGRALVRWQPLGVVGIVVPWNYPLFLAVGPLTVALAAGNRAMVKLSEYTPRFAQCFADLIAGEFAEDEVGIVQGDVAVAEAFTKLPFDALLFTGSTAVGRHVMRAAADNLTPVTLELGGKSPVLIAPEFDLDLAAQRIAFAKLLNAGQTCVAPDYVLVPRGHEAALTEALRSAARRLYGDGQTGDYASIINERQYARLSSMLAEVKTKGGRCLPLLTGGVLPGRKFMPHVLLDVPLDTAAMREEIFGPILPLVPYDSIEQAIDFINERDRPLALYLFDNDKRRVDQAIARTRSGGVTVNDCMLHVAQDDLPFGGIGASGMGHYHGPEGFRTFSKARPIFWQSRFNTLPLLAPPYGEWTRRLLSLMLGRGRWP